MFYVVLAVCALTGLVTGFTYMELRQESGVDIYSCSPRLYIYDFYPLCLIKQHYFHF